MRLTDEPFQQIKHGIKTVEIRLNDEKRQTLKVGDCIDFVHIQDDNNRLKARIIALHHYPTFKSLLSNGLFTKSGCDGYTLESATESLYKYYTKQQEIFYGVVGIEIELI